MWFVELHNLEFALHRFEIMQFANSWPKPDPDRNPNPIQIVQHNLQIAQV